MKKVIILILLLSFAVLFIPKMQQISEEGGSIADIIPFRKKTVCDRTLGYSIGNFDEEFGVSREEFLGVVAGAEVIWEDAMGLDLFSYHPGSEFKINLTYDDRQQRTEEYASLEEQVEKLEIRQEALQNEYETAYNAYQKKLKEYNEEVEDYKDDLSDYNKEVTAWNKKGGAPEDEYKKLEKERKRLKKRVDGINSTSRKLKKIANEVNGIAAKDKNLVKNYNSNVETYENKYGQGKAFDQGTYNGYEINIYQFQQLADLKLVIAHEFGHALGIGHIENANSIMYYLMQGQNLANLSLTQEDANTLRSICGLDE